LQVMTKVELPCALPLIMSGVRNTTLQVIATLTVAAYAPLVGGLGRLIVDGDQNLTDLRYGYPAMVAAAITIAALALVADALLALVQRSIVSPGISGRYAQSGILRRAPIHIPVHVSRAQGGRCCAPPPRCPRSSPYGCLLQRVGRAAAHRTPTRRPRAPPDRYRPACPARPAPSRSVQPTSRRANCSPMSTRGRCARE